MSRIAKFSPSGVIGYASKWRHPSGHEVIVLAPTRVALFEIIAKGILPSSRPVNLEKVKRAQLIAYSPQSPSQPRKKP